jgi:glycosyltransferase involved in cell wall biosynthesis
VHDLPSSKKIFKRVINRVKLFVVLNNNLRDELVGLGVRQENILVSPSGIDLSFFDIDVTKEEAREKLSLPLDKKIVTYTGHFYKWKGVYTLAEVAKIMPETVFVFIGGVEPDITSFKNEFASLNNIIITPFKKRDTIPLYLKASNVLVLPNSGVEKISNSYTSPLKMFEYMASRVPIVASDLSSIREVLNESNSLLSVPDSVSSFELSIKKLLNNIDLSNKLSDKAFFDVSGYTWEIRAKKILSKINENTL